MATMAAASAYPIVNCVGAGRIEGWFWHSREMMDTNGQLWGHVQSHCFLGELVFYMGKANPAIESLKSWKRGQEISFEVIRDDYTECLEAVRIALTEQDGEVQDQTALALKGDLSQIGQLTLKRMFAESNVGKTGGVPELEITEIKCVPKNAPVASEDDLWGEQKKKKKMKTQAGMDEWGGVRHLPVAVYTGNEDAEAKGFLIYAALEDLLENFAPGPGEQGQVIWAVKNLVREANDIFWEDDDGKQSLAKLLNRHPYFTAEYKCSWVSAKKVINVQKSSGWSKTAAPRESPLCWYWTQGRCAKTDCPFRHFLNAKEHADGVLEKAKEEGELCWFWKEGHCGSGEKCTFRHFFKESEAQLAAEQQQKKLLALTQAGPSFPLQASLAASMGMGVAPGAPTEPTASSFALAPQALSQSLPAGFVG